MPTEVEMDKEKVQRLVDLIREDDRRPVQQLSPEWRMQVLTTGMLAVLLTIAANQKTP